MNGKPFGGFLFNHGALAFRPLGTGKQKMLIEARAICQV
jgi:hypothetical protein